MRLLPPRHPAVQRGRREADDPGPLLGDQGGAVPASGKASADRFGVAPRTVETYVEQMA